MDETTPLLDNSDVPGPLPAVRAVVRIRDPSFSLNSLIDSANYQIQTCRLSDSSIQTAFTLVVLLQSRTDRLLEKLDPEILEDWSWRGEINEELKALQSRIDDVWEKYLQTDPRTARDIQKVLWTSFPCEEGKPKTIRGTLILLKCPLISPYLDP